MRQRHLVALATLFAVALAIAACSLPFGGSSSGAAPATPTPPTTPTPTTPAGEYAFVRAGDVWARTGIGPAYQVTFLHVNDVAAAWGQIAWSPDRAQIAFILRAPPLAPGVTSSVPGQNTGTVFVVNVANGTVLSLNGSASHLTAPLLGRHLAWLSPTSLLVSAEGKIQVVTIGAPPAIVPLAGPQNVWEIAVRGATLWYSSVANIQNDTGTGELRAVTPQNGALTGDHLVATLGPVTLPATLCGGFYCPPDTSTPAVPYAWDASADGAHVAYQQAPGVTNPPPTATPTPKPSATPHAASSPTPAPSARATPTPSPTPTATPVPATLHIVLAAADGSGAAPLFAGLPPEGGAIDLAFSPDGKYIALDVPAGATFGPYVQATAAGSAVQTQPAQLPPPNGTAIGGLIAWSPDSQNVSFTGTGIGTGSQAILTFTLTGQVGVTETNAFDIGWAGA